MVEQMQSAKDQTSFYTGVAFAAILNKDVVYIYML